MDKYSKNSLLGQLKQSGLITENNDEPTQSFMPFGHLTTGSETSPFEVETNDVQISDVEEAKTPQKIMKKRLNELDANFFNESSFLNIDDSELTDDEKSKKIKSMIQNVDKKIYMLEDSDDDILLNKLKSEKEALQNSLMLLDIKEGESILSNNPVKKQAIEALAKRIHLIEKAKKIETVFFKAFPMLHKNYLVRKALNKLVMLNESAKELMLKKIPYGESESRYNDFTAYLSCANVIHAKLTKKI